MAEKKDAFIELGQPSSQIRTGEYAAFDFLPKLRGMQALRTYREMKDNDAVIGAILLAMDMMLRSVEWRVEGEDEQAVEFVKSIMDDMSHTWEDFISEVLTFLPFGFSFFETVFKYRRGHETDNPRMRSKYNDGLIGVRKLAPRAQWSFQKWEIDEDGGVAAFVQNTDKGVVSIPLTKGLLFRTANNANDPSGRSILRNAYRSWYYAKHITSIESIAIERELNGLPVGRIPSEFLREDASDDQKTFKNTFENILRDVKKNEQGYVVLPSDKIQDAEGNPTGHNMVEFELMASNGTRDIDTGATIIRHQQDIARSMMADFIMLGSSDKGSFALSKSKTDLFLSALQGYLKIIESTLNRHLLPRLWSLNGFNYDTMPCFCAGTVAPVDLKELGDYIQKLGAAGIQLFPDEELSNHMREVAGLPEQSDDEQLMGMDNDIEPDQ